MRSGAKWIALSALAFWETYWAYVFFSAPAPDEAMDTVFALMMGLLPFLGASLVGLVMLGRSLGRRFR